LINQNNHLISRTELNPFSNVKGVFMSAPKRLAGVKSILAVASGKGGVGKSTVSVNLALAFAKLGQKVGLLDCDIYGPSQHIMLGLKDRTPEIDANRKIFPIEKFGLKMMSFGFFVKPEEAVVWRGPMIGRMIQQFVDDVLWGDLDVLVVDLPPGTGDAQLTLTQLLPLTGAVIVSTPQDVALADAVKGVNMFQKVNVPILGIIENMSFYKCTSCGHEAHIFSHLGAKHTAEQMNVPFLGELPLEEATRAAGDQGKPIVVKEPDSAQAQLFVNIGKTVLEKLNEEKNKSSAPTFSSSLADTAPKPSGFTV
jgi:ATP-binding protein involved in chromosome partitioning